MHTCTHERAHVFTCTHECTHLARILVPRLVACRKRHGGPELPRDSNALVIRSADVHAWGLSNRRHMGDGGRVGGREGSCCQQKCKRGVSYRRACQHLSAHPPSTPCTTSFLANNQPERRAPPFPYTPHALQTITKRRRDPGPNRHAPASPSAAGERRGHKGRGPRPPGPHSCLHPQTESHPA